MRKIFLIILTVVLVAVAGFIYFKYYYVIGEGVKSGYLNFVVKKGYVFKTFEGKLIQEGLKPGKIGGVTSNEFEFSIESDSIYQVMEMNSGKFFDLRYTEYQGALPWRGYSRYVVTEIVGMK